MASSSQAELARAKANVYQFVSNLLVKPPDEPVIKSLMEEPVLEAVQAVFSQRALDELHKLREEWRQQKWCLKDLQLDFWGLFEVPGKRYLAPYESVYRKEGWDRHGQPTGVLYGPSTGEVLRNYWQAGMQLAHDFLDLPDHIGAEVGFMGYLAEREAAAWEAGDEAEARRFREWQQGFLREHLGVWGTKIADKMLEQARTPLYRAVAYMLQALIAD